MHKLIILNIKFKCIDLMGQHSCWFAIFRHLSRRQQDNSPTNQLAVRQVVDWSTRRLVNSPKCLM